MKWLLALIGTLGTLTVCPTAMAALYDGSVGPDTAKARLEFATGAVSGVLCVARPGLSLSYDVYTIGGQNPEGRMSGRLISNGSDVGLFTATKRTTQDEIIWEGTVSLQGASKALKLSRNPSLDTGLVLESGFSFGPQNKDEQSHEPNILIVALPMKNYEGAVALLKSLPAVSDVATADNYVKFIYDTVLDECDRKRRDFMVLHVTVDAFLLKQTYDKLVSSNLFSSVKTTPVPLGPESMEIPIPKSVIGSGQGSPRDISNFLDILVERYFRQLRNTQNACRKHDGSSVFAALQDLPPASGDGVVIDRLETNKFYFRRFSITGPSKSLIFRLPNHWEHYIIELKLYPAPAQTKGAREEYLMEITLSTGEIAPFQESSNPPAERFKPISDNHLQTFVQKYSACISQYVTGSCPDDGGAWDFVRPICGRQP